MGFIARNGVRPSPSSFRSFSEWPRFGGGPSQSVYKDQRPHPPDRSVQILKPNPRIAIISRAWRKPAAAFGKTTGLHEDQRAPLFAEFGATVATLEALGWPADRIQEHLRPARQVFATSTFLRRCQEWPRGYAGDFETIEYLAQARITASQERSAVFR